MDSFLISLLSKTAWPAAMPKPYSPFHIVFSLTGAAAAVFLALFLTRRDSPRQQTCVLFFCGFLLAAGELYKQLFLYYIICGKQYDWWYFPFQLCSTPMYLCLLMPLISRKEPVRRAVCTFLQDFGLLGGIMALAEPSGLFHPYWSLTIHGLAWHVVLVFVGLFLARTNLPGRALRDYLHTLPLLAVFCLIATVINVATRGAADMFYISPYYPITQVVFHSIALRFGNAAGIGTYLASLCAGGLICHLLAGRFSRVLRS